MANIFKKPLISQKIITVSQDGRGDFTTIQSAVDWAQKVKSVRVLLIKQGIYNENIRIYRDHLKLLGDGKVVISGSFYANQYLENQSIRGTFQTATVFINAKQVQLEHLTIRNIAGEGAKIGQAVALYVEGTQIKIRDCRLEGYQDTLCLGPLPKTQKNGDELMSPWVKRVFKQQKVYVYRTWIQGTVDFIFGGGSTIFESCRIHSLKRTNENYLTAASTDEHNSGFDFNHCQITGESVYYLGRPWRSDAQTSFNHCQFDQYLHADGWHDWDKIESHQRSQYVETHCSYQVKPNRMWTKMEGGMIYEA